MKLSTNHIRRYALLLALAAAGVLRTAAAESLVVPETAAGTTKILVAEATQYEHAEGVPRDYHRAAALYCKAAKLGDADAQYALGWMYANGRGVSRDDAIAAQIFSLAADRGHVAAKAMQRYTVS